MAPHRVLPLSQRIHLTLHKARYEAMHDDTKSIGHRAFQDQTALRGMSLVYPVDADIQGLELGDTSENIAHVCRDYFDHCKVRSFRVTVPMIALLDGDVLFDLIKTHKFSAISTHADANSGMVIIIERGQLRMGLPKDVYESIGLVGSKQARYPYRFDVTIDLSADSFVPEKKLYERVKWCFENTFTEPMTLDITVADTLWEPKPEWNPVALPINEKIIPVNHVLVPECHIVPSNKKFDEMWHDQCLELDEWMCLVHQGMYDVLKEFFRKDSFTCLYEPPELNAPGHVRVLQIDPILLSTSLVDGLLFRIQKWFDQSDLPWLSFLTHADPNSPLQIGSDIEWNTSGALHFLFSRQDELEPHVLLIESNR